MASKLLAMNSEDQLEFAEEILKSIKDNASQQIIDGCVTIPISCISDIDYYFSDEKLEQENGN